MSLEPRPHRESEAGRHPFVSQNTSEGDGSRFASEPAPHPRIPDPQVPETIETSCLFGRSCQAILSRHPARQNEL
jgi:hypothetical protein